MLSDIKKQREKNIWNVFDHATEHSVKLFFFCRFPVAD